MNPINFVLKLFYLNFLAFYYFNEYATLFNEINSSISKKKIKDLIFFDKILEDNNINTEINKIL